MVSRHSMQHYSSRISDPALHCLGCVTRLCIEANLGCWCMLMYNVQKLFKENEMLRDCSYASTDQDAIEVLPVEMSYDNFFGRRSKVSQAHFRVISKVFQRGLVCV